MATGSTPSCGPLLHVIPPLSPLSCIYLSCVIKGLKKFHFLKCTLFVFSVSMWEKIKKMDRTDKTKTTIHHLNCLFVNINCITAHSVKQFKYCIINNKLVKKFFKYIFYMNKQKIIPQFCLFKVPQSSFKVMKIYKVSEGQLVTISLWKKLKLSHIPPSSSHCSYNTAISREDD